MDVRIRLGRTGLMVSPICFGTWQASAKFWGEQPKEALIASIRRAYEAGVNFFDTAGAYGDGLAETILGEALAPFPRDRVVVVTKVYHHFHPDGHRFPDLSGRYIEEYCGEALARMRTDYVDLLLCHAFDPFTHPEETTAALEKLKKAGRIRAYGVSNYTAEQLRTARRFGDYAAAEPIYSLLDTEIEDGLLPYCLAEDVGVLVYSPLARGVLTGKFTGDETFDDLRKNSPRYAGEAFRSLCGKVRGLKGLADRHGLTLTQLVLAATLMHPAIHCAIVGIKRPEQIEEAAGAMGRVISREDYYAVRRALA